MVRPIAPIPPASKQSTSGIKQRAIYDVVRKLASLDKTKVGVVKELKIIGKSEDLFGHREDSLVFEIKSDYKSIPDFRFQWIEVKGYFRVYQHNYTPEDPDKTKANHYPLITVADAITACEFVVFYKLLHTNRSNQRNG